MNPVFELSDLHVSLQSHHKEIELVRGVSFAVAPGECLGILGESGSGKSMSMKAAMGLLDHSFYVFRDVETETVSVVYRRNNGGYGLIETN